MFGDDRISYSCVVVEPDVGVLMDFKNEPNPSMQHETW